MSEFELFYLDTKDNVVAASLLTGCETLFLEADEVTQFFIRVQAVDSELGGLPDEFNLGLRFLDEGVANISSDSFVLRRLGEANGDSVFNNLTSPRSSWR